MLGFDNVGVKISQVADNIKDAKSSLDLGFMEVNQQVGELEDAINNAQGNNAQLQAISRLANKIECTEDCYTSVHQADAMIRGLESNDKNIFDLITNINNAARNTKTRRKRSNETDKNEARLFADMIDAAVALQSQKFNFTKIMESKGHSFETLHNLLQSERDISNELTRFLRDANITVPEDVDSVSFILRNKRQIETVGNVTAEFLKTKENSEVLKKITEDFSDNSIPRQLPFDPVTAIVEPIAQQAATLLTTVLNSVEGEIQTILDSVQKIVSPMVTTINQLYDETYNTLYPTPT